MSKDLVKSEDMPQTQKTQIDLTKRNALKEYRQFAALAGQAITVTEAMSLYGVPHNTVWQWAQRGLIAILGRNPDDRRQVWLSHQDVAYCVYVYAQRGRGVRGRRIFNPDGTPWTPRLKPPSAAERRKMRRKELEQAVSALPTPPTHNLF